ncbi:MAG: phosphatase PAP2 family protein [Sulfolobales archaeon]|nr:phosphatase PAP2 family protein [Sulfolobales archaeon]MDW8082911.1 phosphatase PAP2 family protein [Sulfolobales archaeon]
MYKYLLLTSRTSRCLKTVCYTISTLFAILLVTGVILDDVSIWKLFSALGEELAYIGLTLALTYLLDPELGILALASILLSGSLNVFLKYFFNIPRPPPELWRVRASGPGFPSGHAQITSTFWSTVVVNVRVKYLFTISLVLVASVAYSRIGLRVHSVSDVVAGVGVGVALALAVNALLRYAGFEKTILAVSLLSVLLSYRNTVFGHESGVSIPLLGLSASLAVSLPTLKRAMRILKNTSLAERVALLTTMYTLALTATIVSRSLPLEGRFLAYFTLGVLITSIPVAWRKISSLVNTYFKGKVKSVMRWCSCDSEYTDTV